MVVKRVVSIEIGEYYTRICDMDYKVRNPKIYKCHSFETPVGIIEDGFIRDKDLYAKMLKEELIKANITTKEAVFTVSSTKITSREVTIPYVKDKFIWDIVNANKAEYFPMDLDGYTVTYEVLEKKKTEEEKFIRLLVLVAPNHLIKNYYNLASLAGLTIEAIDYIGNSVFQVAKKITASGVQMVVQINETSTILYILEDNLFIMQRTVPFGIETLVESIVESSCYHVRNRIEALELLEKEHILYGELKHEVDLTETAATYIGSEEIYKRQLEELAAKERATNTMEVIIRNIIRVEEYFIAQYKGKKINTIYITGIGAKVRGITNLIHNEITLDVKKVERLTGVNFKGLKNSDKEENYMACIGAAIQPFDFVPKDVLEEKDRIRYKRCIYVVIGAVVVSICLLVYSFIRYRLSEDEVRQLQAKQEKLLPIERLYAKYELQEEEYESIKQFYGDLYTPNDSFTSILNMLESSLEKNTRISSIDSSEDSFSFQIRVANKIQVANLMIKLSDFPQFSSCSMASLTKVEQENDVSNFTATITCEYADLPNGTDKE